MGIISGRANKGQAIHKHGISSTTLSTSKKTHLTSPDDRHPKKHSYSEGGAKAILSKHHKE